MNRRWKIFIAIVVLVLVFTGVWVVTMHFQPASELEAYKQFLRAKGEKLELSQVFPSPVPPESNSLDAVEEAFRLFGSGTEDVPDAMGMVAPGKAMVCWAQPEVRDFDFTNSWEEYAAKVAADRPAIESLAEVLVRPTLDFELDYRAGNALLLPHLPYLKRAAQKLDAAAICDLHYHDTSAAATNILIMLALVQRNASEGLLISHLVRIAITAIAVAPTWELLQATNLTDAQLALVQKGWAKLDFLDDAEHAFVTERVWGMNLIEKLRASPADFEKSFGSASPMYVGSGAASSGGTWEALTEKPRYVIGEILWRSSWSYSDELRQLKSESIILDALRTMQTNRSEFYQADYAALMSRLSSLGITNTGAAFISALKIPDFSGYFSGWGLESIIRRVIRIESARRIVVTAIALKRFQLKHGKLPEMLNELTPEFLATVPIDPYDGKPLCYQPYSDGTYLLYSVGEDGKDEGGNPTIPATYKSTSLYWQNEHALDWVWPQPASPEEIQKYYSRHKSGN